MIAFVKTQYAETWHILRRTHRWYWIAMIVTALLSKSLTDWADIHYAEQFGWTWVVLGFVLGVVLITPYYLLSMRLGAFGGDNTEFRQGPWIRRFFRYLVWSTLLSFVPVFLFYLVSLLSLLGHGLPELALSAISAIIAVGFVIFSGFWMVFTAPLLVVIALDHTCAFDDAWSIVKGRVISLIIVLALLLGITLPINWLIDFVRESTIRSLFEYGDEIITTGIIGFIHVLYGRFVGEKIRNNPTYAALWLKQNGEI